jgi:hypothetical protein
MNNGNVMLRSIFRLSFVFSKTISEVGLMWVHEMGFVEVKMRSTKLLLMCEELRGVRGKGCISELVE